MDAEVVLVGLMGMLVHAVVSTELFVVLTVRSLR